MNTTAVMHPIRRIQAYTSARVSRTARTVTLVAGVVAALNAAACSPSALVDVQTPSTVVDPSTVNTAAGAVGLRVAALAQLMYTMFSPYGYGVLGQSGLFTDELVCAKCNTANLDIRGVVGNNNGFAYANIQTSRVRTHLAREALAAYAANSPLAPRAWQGELYALEGYTLLWLAEQYCNGVPVANVPLIGVATPSAGLTTQELFTRAAVLFDSAAVLGTDSANFVNLARVGKGRALLGLGQFAAADSAVSAVPDDFVYLLHADSGGTTIGYNQIPLYIHIAYFRAVDHKGGNGLVWSADPRTGVITVPGKPAAFLWPAKYNVNGDGQLDPSAVPPAPPIRIADGLEARLIQAEAALNRGDAAWLTILNTLRSTCVGTSPCAPVPGLTASSLPALADPGTDTARLSLVMQERAMWLYFTGHREGDLRRMAHLYHRDPLTLWPTGTYTSVAFPSLGVRVNNVNGLPYSPAYVFAPAISETQNNPLYQGCYDQLP